ncbi:MAG: hypothetical protein AAGA62_06330, partial [Bacteroidota bacterium]
MGLSSLLGQPVASTVGNAAIPITTNNHAQMKIHQLLLPLLLATCLASCGSAPKIAKNDIEPALVAAMQWQEKNPRQADRPTDWTHGAYYTGVARAHAATKNPVFTQAIKDHGERNNWITWERVYHADDV